MIYLYYMLLFVVCITIIINARTPNKALSYLMIVILVPVLGIILYFSVGFDYRKKKLYQKKINIDNDSFPELKEEAMAFSSKKVENYRTRLDYFYPLANAKNITHLNSNENDVEVLINGEEKFEEVLKSLKSAKNHIHIEYYIYQNDEIGNQIADILIKKAKEGITVRFIYDDFGSSGIRKRFVDRLKEVGIEAFSFYTIHFLTFANRLNYRNHRKIIVIDGRVGYVGGINVSDEYINRKHSKNRKYWRDTHCKITGLAVHNLQFIFLTDWNFCSRQNIGFSSILFPSRQKADKIKDCFVQILASGPDSDYPDILFSYIQAVLLSRKEILLTTPYFIPDKAFLDALKIVSMSGVTVKLLVPKNADSKIVSVASKSYYSELLQAGIQLYEYKKGFVHAKTAVFDNHVSFIGTANLDNRSFDLNFEVNALIYNKDIAHKLSSQFENDLRVADEIILSKWATRSLSQKFIEKVSRLISPLL